MKSSIKTFIFDTAINCIVVTSAILLTPIIVEKMDLQYWVVVISSVIIGHILLSPIKYLFNKTKKSS
jgi:hypothetical protein